MLTARPLVGVKVALLPLQATLLAAISPNPTGLRRKVCLSIDPHFIGRLKFTVMLVWTSTSTAPLIGFVDSTTGRSLFDAAAADDPAMHRIIASAAIETRVIMYLRIIEPLELLIANPANPTSRKVYARPVISERSSE